MARYIQGKDGKLRPYDEHVEVYGKPQQRKAKDSNIINRSFDAYESPVSGRIIRNHRERDADMKEHGCVDYEPSLREESTKVADAADAALEAAVDKTVEEAVSQMSSDDMAKLENELNSGADIEVTRHSAGEI